MINLNVHYYFRHALPYTSSFAMDSEFALPIFSHPDSSTFHLFVGFHYTLKQYGDWVRPVQLRCQYSTVQCIIQLHEILQMWFLWLAFMVFRCDFRHRRMGVDPSLATPLPYSLCSTIHSILQWYCFLDTRSHLKNSRWFRDRVAFLLGKDMKDIYYYWFFS